MSRITAEVAHAHIRRPHGNITYAFFKKIENPGDLKLENTDSRVVVPSLLPHVLHAHVGGQMIISCIPSPEDVR